MSWTVVRCEVGGSWIDVQIVVRLGAGVFGYALLEEVCFTFERDKIHEVERIDDVVVARVSESVE